MYTTKNKSLKKIFFSIAITSFTFLNGCNYSDDIFSNDKQLVEEIRDSINDQQPLALSITELEGMSKEVIQEKCNTSWVSFSEALDNTDTLPILIYDKNINPIIASFTSVGLENGLAVDILDAQRIFNSDLRSVEGKKVDPKDLSFAGININIPTLDSLCPAVLYFCDKDTFCDLRKQYALYKIAPALIKKRSSGESEEVLYSFGLVFTLTDSMKVAANVNPDKEHLKSFLKSISDDVTEERYELPFVLDVIQSTFTSSGKPVQGSM